MSSALIIDILAVISYIILSFLVIKKTGLKKTAIILSPVLFCIIVLLCGSNIPFLVSKEFNPALLAFIVIATILYILFNIRSSGALNNRNKLSYIYIGFLTVFMGWMSFILFAGISLGNAMKDFH